MTLIHAMLRSNKCGFVVSWVHIPFAPLINNLSQFVLNLKESNTKETGLLYIYIITATNVLVLIKNKKQNNVLVFNLLLVLQDVLLVL